MLCKLKIKYRSLLLIIGYYQLLERYRRGVPKEDELVREGIPREHEPVRIGTRRSYIVHSKALPRFEEPSAIPRPPAKRRGIPR